MRNATITPDSLGGRWGGFLGASWGASGGSWKASLVGLWGRLLGSFLKAPGGPPWEVLGEGSWGLPRELLGALGVHSAAECHAFILHRDHRRNLPSCPERDIVHPFKNLFEVSNDIPVCFCI